MKIREKIDELRMDARSFVSELSSDWDQAKQLCSHFGAAIKDDVASDFIANGFYKGLLTVATGAIGGTALVVGIVQGIPLLDGGAVTMLSVSAVLGRSTLHDLASAEDMYAVRDGCGGICGIKPKGHHL